MHGQQETQTAAKTAGRRAGSLVTLSGPLKFNHVLPRYVFDTKPVCRGGLSLRELFVTSCVAGGGGIKKFNERIFRI